MDPLLLPACMAIVTIRMEARNQPLIGQIAIGNIIRNRAAQHYASDGTITGTVLAPLQFSCWNATDHQRVRGCQVTWDDPAVIVAKQAWEASETQNVIGDAVLYHTVERPVGVAMWPPSWAKSPKVEFVKQVGDHLFYRVKE